MLDLKNSLKKLADFLDRPLSENDLPELMDHLNIRNFKQNDSVNLKSIKKIGTGEWDIIRRGRVGGNPEMTAEIIEKIDGWTETQLKGTGLKFPYQLRHKVEMYKMIENKQMKK